VRNDDRLNFVNAFTKDFMAHYPGFDAFNIKRGTDEMLQRTVRVKLTQSLGLVTDALVEETTADLPKLFGESPEWQTIKIKQVSMDLVARLSTRVFLGDKLCTNEEWLNIAKNYAVDGFTTSRDLRRLPEFARPLMYWFLPGATRLRRHLRVARTLINEEVQIRKERAQKALLAGEKLPKTSDAIGWMVEMNKGLECDYVIGQLSLSVAAIHTTSEALSHAIMDICRYPEVIELLREEIEAVIPEHGWSKTSLYKLGLLDSFLKESQRTHPINRISMNRRLESEMVLKDGTILPNHTRIAVIGKFRDPEAFPEPDKFDPYRFYNLRAGEEKQTAQHVGLMPEHLGWGFGNHACPGRFFASNELKIALCYLLTRYDWKFTESGAKDVTFEKEARPGVAADAKVMLKRRQGAAEVL
jgi:cytochrome P450